MIVHFADAGTTFADALRKHLPDAVFSDSVRAYKARLALRLAAQQATESMVNGGKAWLASDAIEKVVVIGQKSVERDTNIKFGGVNHGLVDTLKRQMAGELSKAAYSTQGFLNVTIRKATAIAKQAENAKAKPIPNADRKISQSLITSANQEKEFKKASKAMLEKLGLAKGDRVLFLGGSRMEASTYAETVVRTRTIEALNQAKAQELSSNGYQFIETTQHEGVDPKDICYELQGRVWALQANDLGIPILPPEYGLPPWHPNCGHTFAAWQPKFEGGAEAVDKVIEEHVDDKERLSQWVAPDGQAKTYQPAKNTES